LKQFSCRYYVLILGAILFRGSALEAATTLSLQDLLLKARDRNPEIQAARQAWKVSETQIRPAGTWPDPTFTYVDEKFPSGVVGVAAEPIRHYRIEQGIPFPGKLTSESRMKYHETLIAEANYRAKTLDVLSQVRMRYYQLYLTDQKIALAQQAAEVMKLALKSAQARLGSNQTSASDVFMAQTELRRMENDLFQQQQERTLVQIELNTLLDQPTDATLGTAQGPDLSEVPVPLADLETIARRNDPQYLSAAHEVDHSRAMLTRERLQFAPDFGFMYEYENSSQGGPAGRQIGVSVTFPLWFRRPWDLYQGAKEHITEAEASSQAMQNEVLNQLHTEFVQTNTHLRLTQNYLGSILPSALSSLKITREQYANGKADFLRLLETFRTWISTHNEYQEELYQYGEHWSLLERWVGIDLTQTKEALEQQHTMPEMTHH
jgi:cobalt-zinc-cadmium efflux system outer membrane protein